MLELIAKKVTGSKYQADGFKIYYKKKGSVSGDNSENPKELIYLINGEAEITYHDKTEVVLSPSEIEFPANKYHKIVAITDIVFLVIEK